jgi:hypothetical protein
VAVCEGCGTEVCCLHRKQVEKKRRKLAELLTYFEQNYGPVDVESKYVTFAKELRGLQYDVATESWDAL